VGDYVQEGDELCVVSDRTSFVFLLDVPYELNHYIHKGGACEIVLPDKQVIPGTIESNLPSMDMSSQTESFLVVPHAPLPLPENLIARIRIVKNKKDKALTLPKSAILSNETQTEFWVMKLINDSTALKVPVKKGLESEGRTEILSPLFLPSDRILVSGNYGLADTARIIIQEEHPGHEK
jgi:multidrug efflux pump subunit AcrA (membrane-fusion protein)